jgi:replication initiation protein RepC
VPKPTGRRKITPAMNKTMTAAEEWGPGTAVDKKRAHLAFNRVTHLLGLNAQAIELMNKLLSFSQEHDWQGDSRPIVWPDNMRLVCECSFEIAALRRNLRRLAEVGLISFCDSPKGNRMGKRDDNGKIVLKATYGIDLSPLGLIAPKLETMFEADKARGLETRELRRRFTCLRKMIVSIIETAIEHEMPGPWEVCGRALQTIIGERGYNCPLEILRDHCESLERLAERARTAYAAASQTHAASRAAEPNHRESDANGDNRQSKMRPMGIAGDTLIQSTRQSENPDLYNERRPASAEQLEFSDTGSAGVEGFGKKPLRDLTHQQPEKFEARPVDPKTLLLLCPLFKEIIWAPNGVSWREIVETAENVVRVSLQIPQSTWKSACRVMGRERAAVAVALIYEKYQAGLILSAGAYLNGMISKAESGQLALSSSLFHWRSKAGKEGGGRNPPKWN